ncbi:MAG: hypothetical protein DRI74_08760 [Bacteroidetes bacterium]|nr:MAG: hypothetical protein DRI74_08760 [Bacteroidota bacterium]
MEIHGNFIKINLISKVPTNILLLPNLFFYEFNCEYQIRVESKKVDFRQNRGGEGFATASDSYQPSF